MMKMVEENSANILFDVKRVEVRDFLVEFSACIAAWIVFLVVVIPGVVIFFGPFYILKYYIVLPLAKKLHPEFLGPLSPYDGILAQDNYYGPRSYTNLSQILIAEGKADVENFREMFQKNILDARSPSGERIYNKLFLIPVEFGGYRFWKNATDFDIRDHIREDKTPITEREYQDYCSQWITAPYAKNKPLWEVIIHSEFENNCSALTIRIHHSICDGLTLLKMFDVLIGTEPPKFEVKPQKKQSYLRLARLILQAPLIVGHLYISNMFHSNWFTRNSSSDEAVLSWSYVSTDDIKQVRRKTESHFAMVAMSILAGALRKHVKEISPDEDLVDESMNILLPLPWKAHPLDKMANVWTACFIKVPFNYENCHDWLLEIKSNLVKTVESGAPAFTRYSVPFLTLLPNFLLQPFMQSAYNGFSISFTTVPGRYDEDVFVQGHRIKNMITVYGLQWKRAALTSAAFNYKGKTAFSVLANKEVSPDRKSLERLVNEFIPQKLEDLLFERNYKHSENQNGNVIHCKSKNIER